MESLEIHDLFSHLSESPHIKDHPWRWPVLATVSPDAQPHARIVVLREFHQETAAIHLRDATCEQHWTALNQRQRGEYQATGAPGNPHFHDGDAINPSLGMAHFAVLKLAINRLDVVQLTRQAHIRHIFMKKTGQWTGGRVGA